MNKFLVLGTGADINNIDFDKLDNDLIIAGVNRIYEKIIPDIFYCYDAVKIIPDVPCEIETIYTHPAKLHECFNEGIDYLHNYNTYYDPFYTPGYTYEGKHYDCGHGSINYLLRMLNNYLYFKEDNTFYLAGVPLLEGVGHFYDDKGDTTSVQIVLDRFFNDFLRLKRENYNIISVMENSKLNEIFPVENINILYGGKDATT